MDWDNLGITDMQYMIDTGQVWMMEGSLGRSAMALIEQGDCILGPEARRDYWGNLVPAWWMVEPGTLGSPEYAWELGWTGEVDLSIRDERLLQEA